jgi:hypothetical protein
MPFNSQAQRRYFEANKAKLEKQGVDVDEWEESSKGLKLPERAPKSASKNGRNKATEERSPLLSLACGEEQLLACLPRITDWHRLSVSDPIGS